MTASKPELGNAMRIRSLRLTDFRGFTDLTIDEIPSSARLVLLIGPNGTGKSSIFDALLAWSGAEHVGIDWDPDFHIKKTSDRMRHWDNSFVTVMTHGEAPASKAAWEKACYYRSAFRNESEFEQGNLGKIPNIYERPIGRSSNNDPLVARNFRRLIMQAAADVWDTAGQSRKRSLEEYANEVVATLNGSLSRVLPNLSLESLGNPANATGNFYFTKGASRGYPYKNLSGGEKAVFELLLDLIIKRKYFDASVICIDEPEAHVNPRVHGALLNELIALLPSNCQLWVATHAIGMLRRAKDLETSVPGSVAFINFDADFDKPVALRPTKMDRPTWQASLAVALDDMSSLVSPKQVIVCEGGKGAQFDVNGIDGRVYNRIFGPHEPDTQFFSAGSHADTQKARETLLTLSSSILPGLTVKRLIDRDDRSDDEVSAERTKGHLVLTRRNLEAYLFGDEVLSLLCEKSGRPEVFADLIAFRDAKIKEKSAAYNDFRAVRGETYVECKKRLSLTNSGNTAADFMLQTLAPLVTEETETFRQLRKDIFGTS